MKKLLGLMSLSLLWQSQAWGTEQTFTFSELGLQTGGLVSQCPIQLNDDLSIAFEVGGAVTEPKITAAGKVSMPMNSTVRVYGNDENIVITSICFVSGKKSETFTSADCVPEGSFVVDKNAYTSTWTNEEGANSVVITNTMGGPSFNKLTVTYTGGGTSIDPPGPGPDPDPDPDPQTGDYTFITDFSTASEFGRMTTVNVDDRTYGWTYDKPGEAASIRNDFGSTASLPKDDYLVTPALDLKAGYIYRLSFKSWCGNPAYPERIGAYVGTAATADALTQEIVPERVVTNATAEVTEGNFSVPSDGKYYVALHASSDPGMFLLYADDIEVSHAVALTAPAEPTDLSVTPDNSGALSATVSFIAPDKDMAGNPIASLTYVTVKRDGTVIGDVTPQPGERITITDNVAESGMHLYTVSSANASGRSLESRRSVFVGMAAPSDPVRLEVEEVSNGRLHFSWDEVTSNIYGAELAESAVTYTITTASGESVATGLRGNEATVDYLSAEEPQQIVAFAIKAVTTAGESVNSAATPKIAVGTPYAMPYTEEFAGGSLTEGQTAEVIADATHDYTQWSYFAMLVEDDIMPVDEDGGLMALFPYAAGDVSTWRSGKIHIDAEAANSYLSFFYYCKPGMTESIDVAVNGEEVFATTLSAAEAGWKKALIPLAGFKGQDIRLSLTGHCTGGRNRIAIDDIAVRNEYDNDIELVRARIPFEMRQGRGHTLNFSVVNRGVAPTGEFNIVVEKNGEQFATIDCSSLNNNERGEYSLGNVTVYDAPGTANRFTATVMFAAYENMDNNSKETVSVVADNHLPAVSQISDRGVEGGLEISWAAIGDNDRVPGQITETFESYDEFGRNSAGEWSFHDGDGCGVLGIRDGYHTYPGMFSPMSFMVFNNHDGYFPQIGTITFSPHSGGQFMASAAVDVINSTDRENDDWMISPRLSGAAQTISLYARSSGRVFPETFDILASSGGKQTTAFSVVKSVENAAHEWTRYEAELPAGTQYFAIRNRSYDQYMLFVDDVTFEAAADTTPVEGYDVYAVDGSDNLVKLNDEVLTEPRFVTAALGAEDRFVVGTRYVNGCRTYSEPQMPSTPVTVIETSADKSECEYFDLRGIRLPNRPASGFYIEKRNGVYRKIVAKD